MRVQSLQISGFKSFVDRTSFSFRPGITAIVGPNGCGKSNVVDAIRWVMGEQSPRRLRGKGMEDVIFAGSDARSPVGLGEVVLSFDNSDGGAPPAYAGFTEIQIARRLYRSGESEYLINKVPCRLRDVQDFFRDTGIGTRGYTMVEQGRIAEIVSQKPEERRFLIEEAAGISKYKARRREAERKLSHTEDNLTRVTDVLSEIRRQLGSIERQARKAARYKRLRERERLLDLSLAADERAELGAEIERARERATGLRDAVSQAESRVSESDAAVESRRLELAEDERAVAQANETLFQLRGRIKELESKVGYERRERASLAETAEARRSEREGLREQLAAAEEEAARASDELAQVDAALADAERSKAAAESEAREAAERLREAERERDEENARLVDALTRIARAEDRLAGLDERGAEADRRLRSTDAQLEVQQGEATRADEEQRELEEGLRGLLAERDRLQGRLREALDAHARAEEAARREAERLAEARERRETRRARWASLRELTESLEDVGAAARHLLAGDEATRRAHGLRALVRDVIEAEPEAERAAEAVLAERAEGLVVEGAGGALSALAALREADAGRGVLVLPPPEAAETGVVPLGRPLLEHVRARPGFEAVASALLGGVQLVDELREVFELYGGRRLPATFVTPGGDVASPDGIVRGGGEAQGAGALARLREVRELESEVESLDAEVSAAETAEAEARSALARAGDELENLRNRHHTAALAVANREKDLERTRERVKAIGEAREGRAAERSAVLSESEAIAAERERLERELGEAREERDRRQRALDAVGVRVASSGREVSRLEAEAAERRARHASRQEARDRLAEQLERARGQVTDARAWIERRDGEIEAAEARQQELGRSIEQAEGELAEALREEESARREHDARRDAYEERASRVRELEGEARDRRIELEERRDEAQQAELGLRECEMRLEHLDQTVRDRWGVELASWKPPVPADDEAGSTEGSGDDAEAEGGAEASGEAEGAEARAEGAAAGDAGASGDASEAGAEEAEERDARREQRETARLLAQEREARRESLEAIRRKRQSMGEVNLGALEEHEELRERFRYLEEQKGDLEGSVQQLRDAIARINRTSRKRFRETFEAVDQQFRRNFPRLFRGGKASLSLTDAEDVLEAGIEIMAQPPGKRLQSVNLLSGGEKTMTAIALLVSVFQVRPSPFFLLDEVDAALDDANVGRFNEMVRELAETSQFLLITHNKRTIEVADVLYGVTMEEKGVSKLVAVDLH